MKKRIVSLLCAFALILGIMPMTVFAEDPELVYLALGDSITTGYGLTTPSTDSFPALIAKKNGLSLKNLADDGATSADLLDMVTNPENSENKEAIQAIQSADVITITIGGNDLMNALYAYLADKSEKTVDEIKAMLTSGNLQESELTSLAWYLFTFSAKDALDTLNTNLSSIIDYIRKNNPDVTIIVAAQYNPYLSFSVSDNTTLKQLPTVFDTQIIELNDTIRDVADKEGFIVADVYTAFNDAAEKGEDLCNATESPLNLDFHPNAAGHQLIADTINGVLKTVKGIAISATNFPDDAFRQYVLETIDIDDNGFLSKGEIEVCKEINVGNREIQNLTGIQYFTNLQTLYCGDNQLTTLDVSANKALVSLDCNSNQLTELYVSTNTKLQYLNCNKNQLETLDVSGHTELTTLLCYNNQLTELNVSGNAALTQLYCGYNKLTELDVSKNIQLQYLLCLSNRLTTLDVSNNKALDTLSCGDQAFTVDVTSTTDQKWSFDLSTLFKEEEWSKVSIVSVQNATLAADGKTVSWVNGATNPVVQYSYNTTDDPNSTKTMAVTLTLNSIPYEEDDAPEYTITFNGNGGYVSESSVTTTGGKLTSMPVAVRYGYTFTGWYTEDGYLVTLNTVFNHNTTLYAGWQVNEIYQPIEPTRPVEPEPDEPEIEWVREDGNTQLYIDGRMVTGWYQDEDDSWYFFDEDSGIMMQNDWAEVDNVWYYFERDGVMQTGWIEYDDNWYYLKDWGGMATGWQDIDNVWYYFKDWGGMVTGWQYINGNWYYFRGSGAMVASVWVDTNGKWYYLTGSGAMVADRWIEWNGEWYYLYSSGAMATNATIDGYYVNASGAWVQ